MRGIYYFNHDNNAFNHPMVQKIIFRYGISGYGIYFAVLENLHKSNGMWAMEDIKELAFIIRTDDKELKKVIDDMIRFDLLKETDDGDYFYSERMMADINSFLQSKENGKKGGRPKKETTNEKDVSENKDKNHNLNETQNEKGVFKNENPNNNPPFDLGYGLGFEKQKPEAKPEEKRREENKRKQQQQNKYRY